jgi:serine/threonine-protein kinase
MTARYRLEPGTRLGPYRITRALGMGGMASVYEAVQCTLGKRVAIKVLHEHLAANHVAAARFVREGRAASAVRHPNVVEVFEIGVHQGTPYLVMELLEGDDLATCLSARGQLSVAEAVDILLPTASAVATAHAARVVHRDLKPRNIFLAYRRRRELCPKVVDFGIAKVLHDEDRGDLTATETLLGTLDYMAPEQARSAKNATERTDQYALGVILYECLTGRKPFLGTSPYELLHAIVTAPLASPRSLGVEIDADLEGVILRAMRRDPDERFPSVEAFGLALLPFASRTSREVWQDDFEQATPDREDRHLPLTPTDGGDVETGSLVGGTVPEPGVASRAEAPRRGGGAGWVAAFAVLASVSWLMSRTTKSLPAAASSTMGPSEEPPRQSPPAPGASSDDREEQTGNAVIPSSPSAARATSRAPTGALPTATKVQLHGHLAGQAPVPAAASEPPSLASGASASHVAWPAATDLSTVTRVVPSATSDAIPAPSAAATTSGHSLERGFNGAPIFE